ncbi:hypothetical protein B296_00000756 [Ensete ventricosum]|uniref:Uncharacterized protein n=1 Tax=Ensete ventricosum TaxID=4639 RepID=A0A427B5N3_ENSVE|nr:hypothetical protein B296_00000756 [Ensete ventricosum]
MQFKLYPKLIQDVQLVINELGMITILWEELWLSTLQDLHTGNSKARYRAVHTGPSIERHADCPLLVGTVEIDRRWSISAVGD